MKHYRVSLCLFVISCCASLFANDAILYRSQSQDSSRELAGWATKINLFNTDDVYSVWAITPEYTRSFNSTAIAQALFGDAVQPLCKNKGAMMQVSGSHSTNRNPGDLLADYFGLPTDFASTISLEPTIENIILDANLYVGLDQWMCGLWFRIHAPLVYSRWNLNWQETITNQGTLGYDAGYFAPAAIPVDQLNKSFSAYMAGCTPELKSVTYLPLAKDRIRMACTQQEECIRSRAESKFMLSDIQMVFGFNFWQNEDFHLGAGLRAVAPTGTRVGQGSLLFAPVIGNGHHWEAGGMVTTHYTFWRDCDDYHTMGVYFDADVTYLFDARECRTFNLYNSGPVSKYLLLEHMTPTITYNLTGNTVSAATIADADDAGGTTSFPNWQFVDVLLPAANILTSPVRVIIPVQADVTLMINYSNPCFSFDFGYNIWATAKEQLKVATTTSSIQTTTYALKGDSYVYGFDQDPVDPNLFHPVPLSATQTGYDCGQGATIYSGRNFNGINSQQDAQNNIGINNPRFAYGDGTIITLKPLSDTNRRLYSANTAAQAISANNTRTSSQPLFLTDALVNVEESRKQGLSNSFFAHASWNIHDTECWQSYLGVGSKIEIGSHRFKGQYERVLAHCNNRASCADCKKNPSSVSQWAIWIKGGIAYN